jgi:hypothetical protein
LSLDIMPFLFLSWHHALLLLFHTILLYNTMHRHD